MEKENKIKKIYNSLNLYDKLFLLISLTIIITLSIVFKSDALSIIYSTVAIISVFTLSKGYIFAPILLIIAYVIYATQSFLQNLYGEFFLNLAILIPLQITTFVKSIIARKKGKNETGMMKVEKISWKEWICITFAMAAIWAGAFFVLRALNTNYLIASTFSFMFAVVANYLTMRGSKYQFIFYMAISFACVAMWLSPLIEGSINGGDFIPIVATFVIMIVNNIYGIIHWVKLSRVQIDKINLKQEDENGVTRTSR